MLPNIWQRMKGSQTKPELGDTLNFGVQIKIRLLIFDFLSHAVRTLVNSFFYVTLWVIYIAVAVTNLLFDNNF